MTTNPSPSAAPAGGSPGRDAGPIGDGRPDEVGEPLQNVDAHRALAADAKARRAIKALSEPPCRRRRRCGPRRRDAATSSMPFTSSTPPCFNAQSCAASARGAGFSEIGQIKMIGAEAHAEFAQRGARLLRQVLHLLGDLRALEHAERFGDLEGDAAGDRLQALRPVPARRAGRAVSSRAAPARDRAARCTHFERGAGQLLVGEDADASAAAHAVAGGDLCRPARRASG